MLDLKKIKIQKYYHEQSIVIISKYLLLEQTLMVVLIKNWIKTFKININYAVQEIEQLFIWWNKQNYWKETNFKP